MRKSAVLRFFFICFCIHFISACNQEDSARRHAKQEPVSAGVDSPLSRKFVETQDATAVLPDWSKENTVVFHIIGEPDNLHPSNGTTTLREFILQLTQMPVIGNGLEQLDLQPELVISLPQVSDNQLEFTYELRQEPRWDNGEPLTVEDIVFTFKAHKCLLVNNPQWKAYLQGLEHIRTYPENPRKFTMVMKQTYIRNVSFLSDYPVMQRSFHDPENVLTDYSMAQCSSPDLDIEKHQDLKNWANEFNSAKYGREPEYLNGLGAYQVKEWESGQRIVLKRKANHWTMDLSEPTIYETAFPERIILKVNKDKNAQILEFKSQVMDGSASLSTQTLLELQKDPDFNKNYHSRFVSTYNYTYMAMNTRPDGVNRKPFFTDVNVRRAIALLTPVDDIIAVVHNGVNKRICGPVSPLKPDYNSKLKPLPYDVDRAGRLLDEAGWRDSDGDNIRDKIVNGERVSFEVDLHVMNSQAEWKEIAQMIAESMYEGGIKINLKTMDFTVLYGLAENHDFDLMLAAWSVDFKPDDHTQLWHTSSWYSKGGNYSGFGTASTDALIDSIKTTVNDEKRMELSKRFQQMVYSEQPYVFLWSSNRKTVIHKRFGNAHMYFEKPGVLLNNWNLLSD